MFKKIVAEFFGTFTLSLVVLISLGLQFPIPTPFLAALVLTMFVYTIGSVSGCHINPAVTIGLWSLRKINLGEMVGYLFAQVVGAALAVMLVVRVLGVVLPAVATPAPFLLFEMFGTAVFVFSIAAVVFKQVPTGASGVIVGGSLLLGVLISAMGGAAGVLNPAVTGALMIRDIGYYIAQIAGAVIGFQLYAFLISKKKESSQTLKHFLILSGLALLVFAGHLWYAENNNKQMMYAPSTSTEVQEETVSTEVVLGTFKGTLPCADCTGFETELTLTRNDKDAAEGSYVLKETYVGRGGPFVTKGEWTTLRGTPNNADATVYELNPGDAEKAQYYLVVNENEIKMLDRELNEIDAPFNMSLTKVQ